MKFISYLLIGIVFGIVLTKGEVISWFRIIEMFRFESFHMYGVIGSAVLVGACFVFLAKNFQWKGPDNEPLRPMLYDKGWIRYLAGGTIFGLGWAMTGACPGPLFINASAGFTVFYVAIAAALLGTLIYGMVKKYLPE
ncbi:MAG: DUF6691 family protein [Flavobacteriales bacterium]|nr:DUF6691 family protein [Flavobacteriales bacterium]